MNSVVLIGRLTRDVELSYTPNTQTPVARFTLAVDRPRRNGEERGADFLRISVFGRSAENCNRYLSKGRQAAVHGRIETGSYKNNEGVTVYTTDIVADNVEFLGSSQCDGQREGSWAAQNNAGGNRRQQAPQNDGYGNASQQSFGDFEDLPDTFEAADDDIPF